MMAVIPERKMPPAAEALLREELKLGEGTYLIDVSLEETPTHNYIRAEVVRTVDRDFIRRLQLAAFDG
jgi:hypothetical protein